MILWSIQSADAWKSLQASGVLRCDSRFSDKDLTGAYQLMAEQMCRRLQVQTPDGALPLWAWYQWQGDQKRRPDLRFGGHLPPGERGVRLEFELDDDVVLLSDFDLWHFVLNYWYLPESLIEGEAFEAELAQHGLSFYKTKPVPDPVFHKAIRQSWERIFDLEWVEEDLAVPKGEKCIQASFWELPLGNVKRVDQFMAK